MAPRPPELAPRLSSRLALAFGLLLLLGILASMRLWYSGLPALGIQGARAQHLEAAARVLQLSADKHLQHMTDSLREKRGDMLIVAENRVLAEALATGSPGLDRDFERVAVRLQRAYPDTYRGLWLVGEAPASRVLSGDPAQSDISTLAVPLDKARQPGVSELVEQATYGGQPGLLIARAMMAPDPAGRPGTQRVGVIMALLNVAHLLDVAAHTRDGVSGAFLHNAQGSVLAQTGDTAPDFGQAPIANGFEGVLTQEARDGTVHLVAYRYLPLNGREGWTIAHYAQLDSVLAPLERLQRTMLLLALLATLLGLAGIYLASRSITQPLSHLAEVARRFGGGQLGERFRHAPGASREVAQLGSAFNAMADQLAQAQRLLEATVEQRTAELRTARDQLLATLDALPDLLFDVDIDGRIADYHSNKHDLLAVQPDAFLGKTFADALPPDAAQVCLAAIAEAAQQGWSSGKQYALDLPQGRCWFEASVSTRSVRPGERPRYVFLARDITARKLAEDEVHRLAMFDPLTGLANRRLMLDRLDQARLSCGRSGRHQGLLLIDLDRFKDLNDTLGHAVGDQLLVEVAQRLRATVREGDTVARLGGDEFVLVLCELSPEPAIAASELQQVVSKIRRELGRSFNLQLDNAQTRLHHLTLSIGICLFNNTVNSSEELLKHADTAMYQAKHGGRDGFCFYDPAMQTAVLARAALDDELRTAVALQQFVPYFQPLLDARGGCAGAELLVRWQHPRRGLVPPGAFIAQMESSGLILALGPWVLQQACQTLAHWAHTPALAGLVLAVNVSARQVRQAGFVDEVLAAVSTTGIPAQRLKLELTEGMLLENTEEVIAKMGALKATGVQFALDDFGTGYSSLSYLKRLPIDQLKIDRSFVRDMLTDSNDLAIIELILGLGRTLGLPVLAEGVETEAQHATLLELGCTAFQGYLFGPPMPLDAFESWVGTHRPLEASAR